ncbi:MAG: hypothetical protein H7Z38_00105, partial [Rubrivivax sp.]|nr:hypothetical protein [Pyrinomonadaceae bacterium]
MKIPHALLASPRVLLATLCALPFLVAPDVPASAAQQQPAAVQSDPPKPQATPTAAVR